MNFFSPQTSTSTSDSYTGLRGISGNQHVNDMAAFITPALQRGAKTAENLFTNPTSYLDGNGLFAAQSKLFPSIVSQVAGKMSAGAGARGMLSPENVGAIAGSSASAISPFLMDMVQKNIFGVQEQGRNMFSSLMNTGVGALGSESHSTGKSTGAGIGYNWANQLGENLFQWAAPGGVAKGAV